MYGKHTNEEVERFLNMYIVCDVSLLLNPLQNAQQLQHMYEKNHVVYRFHY
jgi:hypothetical protein